MHYLKALKLLTFISVFFYSADGYGIERIGNIVIDANVKTNQRVILKEMLVRRADVVDTRRIREPIQYVMDLNLPVDMAYGLDTGVFRGISVHVTHFMSNDYIYVWS